MANHPNRSQANRSEDGNPTPGEVRRAREAAGLTLEAAATQLHTATRVWQQWEADKDSPSHRRMHPAFFELFLIKTGQKQAPRFRKPS